MASQTTNDDVIIDLENTVSSGTKHISHEKLVSAQWNEMEKEPSHIVKLVLNTLNQLGRGESKLEEINRKII